MARLSLGTLMAAILPLIARGMGASGTSAFAPLNNTVAFALNVPNDGSNNLYFSFSAWSNVSWAAVGMGSDQMYNTLMFMMYPDTSERNITLSPRLSYSHVEPSYSPDINITLLPGTGVENGQMLANAVCYNCLNWKGGWIDRDKVNAPFIFATGPNGSFTSDSVTASVPIHATYGIFTMDLNGASGPPGVLDLVTADTSGTTLKSFTDCYYTAGISHAALMTISILVLMPMGLVFMCLARQLIWHTVCQTVATSILLFGLVTGLYCATLFNRSKDYATVHQILGFIVVAAVAVQFSIGFRLFRLYVMCLASPRKLLQVHMWLGCIALVGGMTNVFLGFRFAYNSIYSWRILTLFAVTVLLVLAFRILIWARVWIRTALRERRADAHTRNHRTRPIHLVHIPPTRG